MLAFSRSSSTRPARRRSWQWECVPNGTVAELDESYVEAAAAQVAGNKNRLLQVKTLGPSHPDVHYARTRSFYEALGFIGLEETTTFWGEANPCLIMVKVLG